MPKDIKFRLCEKLIGICPEGDVLYTAHMDEEVTKVTWEEDETEESTLYSTEKAKQFFNSGDWVKVNPRYKFDEETMAIIDADKGGYVCLIGSIHPDKFQEKIKEMLDLANRE